MMSKRSLTLALALPALLVAGCGGTVNRGLESVHQPVVSRADYAFDLSTANGHLAPGEAQRLDGWLASLNVGYRSEEHTSELQSLMRISYAVFCLKNKNNCKHNH